MQVPCSRTPRQRNDSYRTILPVEQLDAAHTSGARVTTPTSHALASMLPRDVWVELRSRVRGQRMAAVPRPSLSSFEASVRAEPCAKLCTRRLHGNPLILIFLPWPLTVMSCSTLYAGARKMRRPCRGTITTPR